MVTVAWTTFPSFGFRKDSRRDTASGRSGILLGLSVNFFGFFPSFVASGGRINMRRSGLYISHRNAVSFTEAHARTIEEHQDVVEPP
jgi:hypothetical protein